VQPQPAPEASEVQSVSDDTAVVGSESADVDAESRIEPIPIDTTAELLGRAKPRRPRTRLGVSPAPRGTRKAAARKPSGGRRAPRGKKAPQAETPEEN
jgi:hypothetical protein